MSQCEPKQDTAWLAVPLLHHANSRSARLCNYMGDGERSNRRGQGCTVKREVRRQVLHKDWNNSRELSSEKSLRLTNGRTTRQMACVSDSREQNKKTTNDVFRTITQDHLLTITAAQVTDTQDRMFIISQEEKHRVITQICQFTHTSIYT